jgi:hypothetical protein
MRTLEDRTDAANYFVAGNTTDARGWVDAHCPFTSPIEYVCEFEGA